MTWMISNPSKRYAVTIRRSEHHSFLNIFENYFLFCIFIINRGKDTYWMQYIRRTSGRRSREGQHNTVLRRSRHWKDQHLYADCIQCSQIREEGSLYRHRRIVVRQDNADLHRTRIHQGTVGIPST